MQDKKKKHKKKKEGKVQCFFSGCEFDQCVFGCCCFVFSEKVGIWNFCRCFCGSGRKSSLGPGGGCKKKSRGMGSGLLDLEKHFSFYGAYHSNKVNIWIHVLFVWPIVFTAMMLLAYTKPLAPQLPVMASLPFHEFMVLNYTFVFAAVYALFYISLDPRAGSLAAFLVLACWVGANAAAQSLPFVSGRNLILVTQGVCWTSQFIGHGVFEKRAPALLDNIVQAFLMAPFFVLLEVLQSTFHYEPYPGFSKSVESKVNESIAKFRASKKKKNLAD